MIAVAHKAAVIAAAVLVLGLTPCRSTRAHANQQPHVLQALTAEQQHSNARRCGPQAPWAAVYAQIEADLTHWAPPKYTLAQGARNTTWGITSDQVDALIDNVDSHWPWRRIGFLFEGGKPFIITDPTWPREAGHHRMLATAYAMLMVGLSRLYGASIPNVEFVVATSDGPSITLPWALDSPSTAPPLFRFCKTQHHADVLVPDIHFHMRAYSKTFLDPAFRQSLPPWSARKPRLFGRFSRYQRFFYAGSNSTYKTGFRGAPLCPPADASPGRSGTCPVRQVFMEWAGKKRTFHGVRLDVASQPRVSMPHHATAKYLLHLDGQTCSSRLEQLLALGSLVFKEDSGYYAFYHHLLKPYEHYIPFWRKAPEELLEVLDWATHQDNRSHLIATAGQAFASVYLHNQVLSCYWLQLLTRFAQLLRFKPGGARHYRWRVPAEQWLGEGPGARIVQQYKLKIDLG